MKNDHILTPIFDKEYPVLSHGEGIYLYDIGGKKYMDATSGAVLCSLGHGVTEIADTLYEQSKKLAFAYRWNCVTEPLQKVCTRLCERSNNNFSKAFLISGGSEATEIAIKLAREYHVEKGEKRKYKIISRWQSYHGSTMGALSLTGHRSRRRDYEPYLFEHGHIPPAYCYRCWFGETPETCHVNCADALERQILCQDPETIAAFIMEPVSGMSLCGAYPKKEYFQKVREICDEYDVLLIYDEVMTGIGRTGKFFSYEHFDVVPDIIALGKALAGGYFPIGAVMCNDKIYESMERNSGVFQPGYSWAGSPLASAVSLRTLDYLDEHDLINRCAENGEYLRLALEKLAEFHPTVGDVRGLGLMVGIEFVKDKQTRETFDADHFNGFAVRVMREAQKRNVILGVGYDNNSGKSGDMAMIAPAYIITKEQIDTLVGILDETIRAVEKTYGY